MSEHTIDRIEAAFGQRVRTIRIERGLSQDEVARKANLSRTAVSSLESGGGSSLATVVKVLRVLDRSDWLLTLEAPDSPFNPLDLLHQRHDAAPKGPPRVRRARSERTAGPARDL